MYGSTVTVEAPTHRASREEEDEFLADLQREFGGISVDDVLTIVGDFNAGRWYEG